MELIQDQVHFSRAHALAAYKTKSLDGISMVSKYMIWFKILDDT